MSAVAPSVLFDTPGPKTRRRHLILGVIGALLIAALLAWVTYQLRAQLTGVKWKPMLDSGTWIYYLLPGLANTVKAATLSILAATALGLVLGLGRMSTIKPINWIASAFVEFFRSVPVLMMMIFANALYIQLDWFSGETRPLAGVITGLTLYNGCVIAELIRAGVHALPAGQREAGTAIGLTRRQTMMLILLPQAISSMLPSLVAQLVVVLKDTTLGYLITYPDLLRAAQNIDAVYGNILVDFVVAGAIFYLLNWSLTRFASWLETRLRQRRATPTNQAAETELALAIRNPGLGAMYDVAEHRFGQIGLHPVDEPPAHRKRGSRVLSATERFRQPRN